MKNYIKIICILDKSGSMSSIINDSILGFNYFLKNQKEVEGDATITTHLFDTRYETIYKNVDIKLVKDFNKNTYVPRGGTALFDAILKTYDDEIEWLSSISPEERPEKTLCVILTDGEENSSKKCSKQMVNEIITELRDEFKWEFIFLGANIDSFSVANDIGISVGNTMNYTADSIGVQSVYTCLDSAVKSYRSSSNVKIDNLFQDENIQGK